MALPRDFSAAGGRRRRLAGSLLLYCFVFLLLITFLVTVLVAGIRGVVDIARALLLVLKLLLRALLTFVPGLGRNFVLCISLCVPS